MTTIPCKANFYSGLTKTALYKSKTIAEQIADIDYIDEAINKLQLFNSTAKENCEHKLYILQAERFRILDNFAETIRYFELAIKSARINSFMQEEALANELYAKFWLENDSEKLAKIFLNEAILKYKKWEAKRKINLMISKYSNYLEERAFLQDFDNLEKNAGRVGLDFSNMPLVIQFNKRDLKEIVSEEEIRSRWEPTELPLVFGSALHSRGVRQTFVLALKTVFRSLDQHFNLASQYGLTEELFLSVVPPPTQDRIGHHEHL